MAVYQCKEFVAVGAFVVELFRRGLPLAVVKELGPVGKESSTNRTSDNFFLGVAAEVFFQLQ